MWEQGIIYTTAVVLGIISGAMLSALVIPALIFTSVAPSAVNGDISSTDFYALQNIPPIQIIIPPTLVVALAVLVVICLVAIALMVRVVSRPWLSQAIRLNED